MQEHEGFGAKLCADFGLKLCTVLRFALKFLLKLRLSQLIRGHCSGDSSFLRWGMFTNKDFLELKNFIDNVK